MPRSTKTAGGVPGPVGLWPEASMLDQVDKRISRAVFLLDFGPWFEYFLTVPGIWFGAPTTALGILPLMLSCVLFEFRTELSIRFMAALSLLSLVGWVALLAVASRKQAPAGAEAHGVLSVVYTAGLGQRGVVAVFLTMPHITLFLVQQLHHDVQVTAGVAQYFSVWYTAVTVSEMFKKVFYRLRPCAVLEDELKKGVKRVLPEIQYFLRTHSRHMSFPSGDAAGATAFSYVSYSLTGTSPFLLCAFGSAFGRMYFHAHHLLDVLGGIACGIFAGSMLHNVGPQVWTWSHFLRVQLLTIACFVAINKAHRWFRGEHKD